MAKATSVKAHIKKRRGKNVWTKAHTRKLNDDIKDIKKYGFKIHEMDTRSGKRYSVEDEFGDRHVKKLFKSKSNAVKAALKMIGRTHVSKRP